MLYPVYPLQERKYTRRDLSWDMSQSCHLRTALSASDTGGESGSSKVAMLLILYCGVSDDPPSPPLMRLQTSRSPFLSFMVINHQLT